MTSATDGALVKGDTSDDSAVVAAISDPDRDEGEHRGRPGCRDALRR